MKIRTLKIGLLMSLALLARGCTPMPAFAQSTTQTYTGVIQDLAGNPVTSGQVTFTLTPSTSTTLAGTAVFIPTTISCAINSNGTLSGYVAKVVSGACIVKANTSISPSGTSYRICTQPQFTTPGTCFYDYALGGTKDISLIAPTLSTGPINYGGVPGPTGPIGPAGPIGTPNGTNISASLATNPQGVVCEGDSRCANGGAKFQPFQAANGSPFINQMVNYTGGTGYQHGQGGDQACDVWYKYGYLENAQLFTAQPQPLRTLNIMTNDAFFYQADANRQIIAQRCYAADALWTLMPRTSRIYGTDTGWTKTGTWANDTTTPAAVAGLPIGITSTTNNSTASHTVTAAAGGACYVIYNGFDAKTGTLTISEDGTALADSYTGSTTFNSFGDGSSLIATENGVTAGAFAARFGSQTAGTHTFLITVTSATGATNPVDVEWIGCSGAASNANPVLVAHGVQHVLLNTTPVPGTYTPSEFYTGTYDTLVRNAVTLLAGDNWNFLYADVRDAIGTTTANFAGDQIHLTPSAAGGVYGYQLEAQTVAAAVAATSYGAPYIINVAQHLTVATPQPTVTPTFPVDFFSPNPASYLDSTQNTFSPGISWLPRYANQTYFTTFAPSAGITEVGPAGVGLHALCQYPVGTSFAGSQFTPIPLNPKTLSCFEYTNQNVHYFGTTGAPGATSLSTFAIAVNTLYFGLNGITNANFYGDNAGRGLTFTPFSSPSSAGQTYGGAYASWAATWNNASNVVATASFKLAATVIGNTTPTIELALTQTANSAVVAQGMSLATLGYIKLPPVTAPQIFTTTICNSTASPAACGASTAGKVQLAAAATTLTINSTAITANTSCTFTYDVNGITAPTNIASLIPPYISGRTAGTSLTLTFPVAPTGNPVNVQISGCTN